MMNFKPCIGQLENNVIFFIRIVRLPFKARERSQRCYLAHIWREEIDSCHADLCETGKESVECNNSICPERIWHSLKHVLAKNGAVVRLTFIL